MAPDGEPALDTTTPTPGGSVERHDVYYLETIVFRVEDVLFRVPRRSFELDSTVFKSMFSLPTGQHNPEGQDDNSPITLQAIKKKDFESLLKMMYPMGPKLPKFTHEELVAVLHLSTMWELAKIRECVIEIMDGADSKPMDPVERIILAKKERISAWLRSGCKALVEGELLTIDKVKMLDWETIAKLFSIQHRLPGSWERRFGRQNRDCSYCGRRGTLSGQPTTGGPGAAALLEETFQNELLLIEEEEYEKGWKVRRALSPVEPSIWDDLPT